MENFLLNGSVNHFQLSTSEENQDSKYPQLTRCETLPCLCKQEVTLEASLNKNDKGFKKAKETIQNPLEYFKILD